VQRWLNGAQSLFFFISAVHDTWLMLAGFGAVQYRLVRLRHTGTRRLSEEERAGAGARGSTNSGIRTPTMTLLQPLTEPLYRIVWGDKKRWTRRAE
jgi:hypothetical protein